MKCATCGREERTDANFCSNCGRVLAWRTDPASALPYPARLMRPRSGRMIAGVCAGIAQQNGWDISLVRVATLLLIVFTGVGLLVYLAAWVVIPNAPYLLPAAVAYVPQPTGTMGQ